QWYAHFFQKYSVPSYQSSNPPAVLGVDLGIKKTAVAVLLTPRGKVIMDEVRFIVNKERQAKIFRLNKKIQSIQRELDTRINTGQPHSKLNVKLAQLRRRRRSITENELGYAVNQLTEFILQLKNQYNLFVSVGYPKDIRQSYTRGSGNKSHRRRLHKWCYRLFITKLRYKLKQEGFDSYRVVAVNEDNTSKICSRCNSKTTTRTGQGKFNCSNCNYELNADLNGAKNIAKRLLKYVLKPKYNYIWDLLTKDTHNLERYDCFQYLSQWLKSP
ncbi:MAG: zinc ribbon domain-containing protein, partial [Candidatus Heimdallarchaeaceae archaeon]